MAGRNKPYKTLEQVLAEMKELVKASWNDSESAHVDADVLLTELCMTIARRGQQLEDVTTILEYYDEVKKHFT
jgi:hypothetical protein